MSGAELSFSLFSSLALGGAIVALLETSVVRSAFAMFGTFLGVAGLYLTLGADFLAMTQVLIYAGGIMVLYLFGLMLTKPSSNERNMRRIGLAAGIAGTLSVIFLVQLFGGIDEGALEATSLPAPEPTAEAIGLAFLRADEWLFAFEFASVLLLATLVGAVYIARRRPEPRAEEVN